MESRRANEQLVDLWFHLKDHMLETMGAQESNAIRPPSLRDVAYVFLVSMRSSDNPPEPEMTESFINGLELGAIAALREAWTAFRTNPLKGRSNELQGPSEDL
jgi:hypothetical protein